MIQVPPFLLGKVIIHVHRARELRLPRIRVATHCSHGDLAVETTEFSRTTAIPLDRIDFHTGPVIQTGIG